MSVNTMGIEQGNELIALLHEQATGQKVATPTNLSEFISVASSVMQNGVEPLLNSISIIMTKTLMGVRPYDAKFKGLEETSDRWGGIIRKISFVDTKPETDPTYELIEGESVDQWKIKKAVVVETRYVGSVVFKDHYTISEPALKLAFSSPAELARFFSAMTTHFSNQWEQWKEELARSILSNIIGAKNQVDSANVIHLLTEYNTLTGNTYTRADIMKPENIKGFGRWLYSRLETLSNQMTERSELFQMNIKNKPIMRHTPKVDQKFYINAPLMAIIEAQVNSDTYHENFLKLAEHEKVNYWQAIREPEVVKVKPVYMNEDGVATEGAEQVVNNVVGLVFDRDACGYNVYDEVVVASPYNADGQFYNLFHHARVQLQNDMTEKAVVLLLD